MGREILFRGKHIHVLPSNQHLEEIWVDGYLQDETHIYSPELEAEWLVDPDTVCRCITLADKRMYEGNICIWSDPEGSICTGIVKFGEWQQDGSAGEYPPTKCIGWYVSVEVVRTSRPDVMSDAECAESYPFWKRNMSLAEVVDEMKYFRIIGNIFDNPELLEMNEDD